MLAVKRSETYGKAKMLLLLAAAIAISEGVDLETEMLCIRKYI